MNTAEFKAAMAELKTARIEIRRTGWADGAEYRVNFAGGAEATAYYTEDRDDAIATGHAMRRRRDGIAEPIQVTYSGPECWCGEKTVCCDIAAPGYGRVRVCKRGHSTAITRTGELDIHDVI